MVTRADLIAVLQPFLAMARTRFTNVAWPRGMPSDNNLMHHHDTGTELYVRDFEAVDELFREIERSGELYAGDDRWENGFRSIVTALGYARKPFEIRDIVAEVTRIIAQVQRIPSGLMHEDQTPVRGHTVEWLTDRAEAAHRDAEAHPEGSGNRTFYFAQATAYENALSYVAGDGALVGQARPSPKPVNPLRDVLVQVIQATGGDPKRIDEAMSVVSVALGRKS